MKTYILALVIGLSCTSCTVSFDPVTGNPSITTNATQAAIIAEAVADRINEKIIDATK